MKTNNVIKTFLFASLLAFGAQSFGGPNEDNIPYAHTEEGMFYEILMAEGIPVTIYLVNGIKLEGLIERHTPTVIFFKDKPSQLVYKQAISTVLPLKGI